MCNTLESLFEPLSNKFKPQYNETIKSLQFRKLHQYDDEEYRGVDGETAYNSSGV